MSETANKSIVIRLKETLAALQNIWMGPGTPVRPIAPGETPPRTHDYLTNTNFSWVPRKNERIGYKYMRALAEGSYMCSIILDNVAERIAAKPWEFRLRAMPGEPKTQTIERSAKDIRIRQLTEFYTFPDREHTWREWLKMWLHETMVIDAASILFERSCTGKILRTIIIDGATINRNIDAMGMTPLGTTDIPAYQQVIHGSPMINLSASDLLYAVRCPRVHKLWGFSPVEKAILILETQIMRSIWQKDFYDTGNMPIGYIQLPDTWSADEMTRFMKEFRALLDGNLEERNKVYPVPGKGEIKLLKQEDAHQKFDEWIARVLCYALGETASPFVQQQNRATAQQSDDTREEGSERPLESYVEDVMNKMLQAERYWNYPDVEWRFSEQPDIDILKQAQVDQINVTIQTRTPNELRARDGLAPLEGGDEPVRPPSPPDSDGEDDDDEEDEGNGKPPSTQAKEEKLGKALKADKPKRIIVRPTDADASTVAAFGKQVHTVLTKVGAKAASLVSEAYAEAIKADGETDEKAQQIAAVADDAGWDELVDTAEIALYDAADTGQALVFAALDMPTSGDLFDQVDEGSVAYARDRAAEMVGMKWVDGELVANPSAEWAITDTTRANIQKLVSGALENGVSVPDLKLQIQEMTDFSEDRSEMIAETEIGNAHVQSAYNAAQKLGGTTKEWLESDDENECEECSDYADLGPVPFEYEYEPGLLSPLAHPRCQCDLAITIGDPLESPESSEGEGEED